MTRQARFLHLVVTLAALTSTRVANGQVVRGTVTDRTGAPARGAVVTLSRAAEHDTLAGTDVRTVLADVRGAYSVQAPSAGRYRIIVRRIGSRPWRSDLLVIAAGQSIQHDVVLEALLPGSSSVIMPEIRVTRATPCRTEAADANRIASLWNDARTALLAAEASLGGGETPTLLIRYSRQLDPRPEEVLRQFDQGPAPERRVLREVLQVVDHADIGNRRGFESISGDSLSARGYWTRMNGIVTYHAPDATALLSEAFVRDHCFRVIEALTEERDSIGLFFQPIPSRATLSAPPEIRGAAWFDAENSRLRRIEFNWTKLHNNAPPAGLGGDLSFTWSENGTVYVDRWELRMPQTVVEHRELGFARNTLTHHGIVEEGGVIFSDSSATTAGHASVQGTIKLENGAPLTDALVRVLGTSLTTTTDRSGKFFIDSVPAGLRVLVADHPSYASFGVRASAERILLDAGENRELSLTAPGREQIATQLCGMGAFLGGRAILRLTVVDSATAQPLGGVRLRLTGRGGAASLNTDLETDDTGAALFCGLPPDQPLELTSSTGAILLSEFRLPRNNLALRQVWLQRP